MDLPDLPSVLVAESAVAQGAEAVILAAQAARIPILAVGPWPEQWEPPLGRLAWNAPIGEWVSLLHGAMAFGSRAKFTPEVVERPMRSLSVLGAEDDLINIKVLRRMLENAGHRFHVVHSGNALLEEINKGGYDIVISDVNMPGIR